MSRDICTKKFCHCSNVGFFFLFKDLIYLNPKLFKKLILPPIKRDNDFEDR